MAHFNDPKKLAQVQLQRMQSIKAAAEKGHFDAVNEVKAHAYVLVSGTLNPTKGAYAKNPASRKITAPLLPINVKTGDLRNSLTMQTFNSEDTRQFQLSFTAPEARFVLSPTGTKFMQARGFFAGLFQFAEPTIHQRTLEAKRNAERDTL